MLLHMEGRDAALHLQPALLASTLKCLEHSVQHMISPMLGLSAMSFFD
jgi:hypothetical protein